MSHGCKALTIHCMDFRLPKRINTWLSSRGLAGNSDLVVLAGGAKNLLPGSDAQKIVLKQVGLSLELHGISELVLMNHTDCGAYGGAKAFENTEAETKKHTDDLKEARRIIAENFPSLSVHLILARIRNKDEVDFEEIE